MRYTALDAHADLESAVWANDTRTLGVSIVDLTHVSVASRQGPCGCNKQATSNRTSGPWIWHGTVPPFKLFPHNSYYLYSN
jgi:hypothetical protein